MKKLSREEKLLRRVKRMRGKSKPASKGATAAAHFRADWNKFDRTMKPLMAEIKALLRKAKSRAKKPRKLTNPGTITITIHGGAMMRRALQTPAPLLKAAIRRAVEEAAKSALKESAR